MYSPGTGDRTEQNGDVKKDAQIARLYGSYCCYSISYSYIPVVLFDDPVPGFSE
jgi:hypothetical protein